MLCTFFTNNCVASHKDNTILKFAENTIGKNTGGHETREVAILVTWRDSNNPSLSTDKTRERTPHQPLIICESEVEKVRSFKFLGVHISDDLIWTCNTTQLVKKAQ